jgi:hypothetical protein
MPVYSWGMFWKKAQAAREQADGGKKCPAPWYAKLGVLAFTFFLLKGLLWLTVPAVLAYLGSR